MPDNDTPTPAHAKIGAEGVQRLRARYVEILARIPERTPDPQRQEELKRLADRLNPDSWGSDEDVAQGLEQYESVFASLREVVGQKRRRRRRGRGPRPAEPGGGAGTDSSASFEGDESPDPTDGPEGGGDSSEGES